MDKRNLLCKSELFSTLDPEEIDELIALASEVELKVGEILFTRGSEGDELFVLVSGRVCLELDGRDRKTISLGALGEGDMFGEVSVLDGGKRSATIKATEPSELLAVRRNDLIELMQRFPNIAIKLLGVLAKKLRMTNELIEDSLGFNLASKVAKELLGLARAYGQNTSNGIKITVDFSESELAGIVGTTVSKLEEQLQEWQRENVVTMSRGYITITDVHKLKCLV